MKEQNMNPKQKQKVFDDFKEVDCEECEAWQLNQCDGVPVGSQRSCTAYKAVRRLNTPLQIKALQKGYKELRMATIFNRILIIILALEMLLT
jgi:hypothetical protein